MDVEESTVLSSWKDIAGYLGKGVRTVQRWERDLGLPVRRPIGAVQKSAVLLHRGDVDAWLLTRFAARTIKNETVSFALEARGSAAADLRAKIEAAQKLVTTQQMLTQQITDTIRELTKKCDLLNTQRLRLRSFPAPTVSAKLAPVVGERIA